MKIPTPYRKPLIGAILLIAAIWTVYELGKKGEPKAEDTSNDDTVIDDIYIGDWDFFDANNTAQAVHQLLEDPWWKNTPTAIIRAVDLVLAVERPHEIVAVHNAYLQLYSMPLSTAFASYYIPWHWGAADAARDGVIDTIEIWTGL